MFRMVAREKSEGRANTVNFYASLNFPATVYVEVEADNDVGIPSWLTTPPWNAQNRSVVRLLLYGTEDYFGCFFLESEGTVKNRYDGVKSGAIAFYTNTLPGADTDMSLYASYYTHHYVVLAVPKVVLPPGMDLDIVYDMGMFIQSLFTYGLIYAWITWLGVRFLRKINFPSGSYWAMARDP